MTADLTATLNRLESQRTAALARAEKRYDRERDNINAHFAAARQRLEGAATLAASTAPTVLHVAPPAAHTLDTFTVNGPLIGRLWGGR